MSEHLSFIKGGRRRRRSRRSGWNSWRRVVVEAWEGVKGVQKSKSYLEECDSPVFLFPPYVAQVL
jgi:hypothetical protein